MESGLSESQLVELSITASHGSQETVLELPEPNLVPLCKTGEAYRLLTLWKFGV